MHVASVSPASLIVGGDVIVQMHAVSLRCSACVAEPGHGAEPIGCCVVARVSLSQGTGLSLLVAVL